MPEVLGQALGALPPELRAAFLRLGTRTEADGPASQESEAVLEQLVDTGMLEDGPPGPYRLHDFLRIYARWHVRTHETAAAAAPR